MKKIIFRGLLCALTFMLFSMTQAQTVSGTVTDETGPLPGVNVKVKGTNNGTTTDFDGQYSLNGVPQDGILVFSFVGYGTQEIGVMGRSVVDVSMATDAAELEEVVLIGYGQTTVRDATGAVSSVNSEEFNRGVISSPEELIQGKSAGVQITQSSGEPGAGMNIRIRGTNSIRSNNNPLFVVDGVPLAGDNTAAGGQDVTGGEGGTSASRNPLTFLNPNDIESVSILKDASATAIYGSRGANGVVIITTKSGRGGAGGSFEFTSNTSISSPAQEYDLLDREQFLSAVNQFGGNAEAADFGANTDWQDVVTRTVVSHDQNLSYSQNYGSGNIRATVGYQDQQGILANSSMERITGRINWTQRFFDDRLTLNLQTTASRVNDEAPLISGSAGFRGDILGMAYSSNPTWPNDPEFNPQSFPNPANVLANYQSRTKTDRALLNGSVEYKITSDLTGKVNLGYDTSESTRRSMISPNTFGFTTGIQGNGRGAVSDIDAVNRLFEATLNYNTDIGDSKLDVLAGYSFQDFRRSGRNIAGWGFSTADVGQMADDLENSANAIEANISGNYQQYGFGSNHDQVFVTRLFPESGTDFISIPSGLGVQAIFTDTYDYKDELQSFFGRVNYSIAGKYLFTATLRADGSSRFGPDNKYGYFPSGAFAWQLADEDFIGDAVSTLKLRLGFGVTGNQEGLGYGNYLRRVRFGGVGIQNNGGINNLPGLGPVAFQEPNLKWESTTSYNVGLDFGFINDRLNGSIDLYRKETTDLLLFREAAQPSPQPFFFQNIDATVLNQGIEFAIGYDFVRSEDFNLDASFNIAYNENELQDFGGSIPAGTIYGQGLTGAFAQVLAGGRPLFSYYLREFEGFDEDGQPIGDVQTFVGKDAIPDYNAGFSLRMNYKNWDLSTFFAGQFDFHVYNNTRNAFFTAGSVAGGRNVTTDVIGLQEAGSAAAPVSTRFLERGDFVRLQNLNIGYNVPLPDERTFKRLRISLTGQNLLLITNYSGLDPEVSVQPGAGDLLNNLPTAGIDYTSFPRPRTITVGFNAAF